MIKRDVIHRSKLLSKLRRREMDKTVHHSTNNESDYSKIKSLRYILWNILKYCMHFLGKPLNIFELN